VRRPGEGPRRTLEDRDAALLRAVDYLHNQRELAPAARKRMLQYTAQNHLRAMRVDNGLSFDAARARIEGVLRSSPAAVEILL
jgi:hypothetical protein